MNTQLSFSRFCLDARGLCCLALLLSPICTPFARSDDWPQVLGPSRNGTTVQLPMQPELWQPSMKPAWTIDLGSGYAGPAILADTVYVPHRKGELELLTAVDLKSGEVRWQSSWEASYGGGYNADDGPRCVPSIQGESLLCYGAGGDLVCFNITTGTKLWQRALRKEYKAPDGYFGAGSSPLIVGELVVVCVGGEEGGVVAIDINSGKTRWTATDYEASYASPISFSSGSEECILAVMRLNTVLLKAKDGTVLSDIKYGGRGPTVNAATPIALDDLNQKFLLTASYNIGTLVLSVDGLELKEEYRDRRLLASQYNSPVRVGETVYSNDGREDVGNGRLRAIDPLKPEVLWEQPDFGTSHLIGFEKQILALDLDGRVVLFDASPKEFKIVAETRIPDSIYRSLPALSGRYFVVRANDRSSSSRLMMFQLP